MQAARLLANLLWMGRLPVDKIASCLSMGADRRGVSGRLQTPAPGKALNLTCSVRAITARADEHCIWSAIDAFQDRVVRPSKKSFVSPAMAVRFSGVPKK